jgi:uncharacterized repeat protein (TIGR03803 family)
LQRETTSKRRELDQFSHRQQRISLRESVMKTRRLSQIFAALVTFASFTLGLGMSAQAQTESTLYNFPGGYIGGLPESDLIMDSAGNLYGTTLEGGGPPSKCGTSESSCGTVFELSPSSGGTWTETVLHSFSGDANGGRLFSGLVQDAAGNLYGTTTDGGNLSACVGGDYQGVGCGVVFKLSRDSAGHWKETVLYTFSGGADGAFPFADLMLDSAGNIYGTTVYGGFMSGCAKLGCGVVFRLTRTTTGWHEAVLHSFGGNNVEGNYPSALVQDASGNLYGTVLQGGAISSSCESGCGMAFELSPTSSGPWTFTLIHSFTGGSDGANPSSSLTLDTAGNLFGVTQHGGANSVGNTYKLSPSGSSWVETVIYNFTAVPGVVYPSGALHFDAAGNLYGASKFGGSGRECSSDGCGVVYKLSPSGGSWTETDLYSFTGTPVDGDSPNGALRDAAGNLYGTASGGNPGYGDVFEVTP